jgi:general secretion pathway protein H
MPTSAPGSNALARAPACAGAPTRPLRVREGGFTPVRRSAEHGFTMARRSAEHGFTLVELMVVVTLIGLVATVAVLAMPDPRGRLVDEAERFAARTRAAQTEAIVTATPVSVWVTAGGYGFDQRRGSAWAPIGEKPLGLERWREGTRVELSRTAGRVRLTFDPTGIADQVLDLRLTRDRAAALVRVEANGSVRVDAS